MLTTKTEWVYLSDAREDSMYDYKFIGLSHNTVRGAAGGAVLCAEALTAKGYIQANKCNCYLIHEAADIRPEEK